MTRSRKIILFLALALIVALYAVVNNLREKVPFRNQSTWINYDETK